VATPSATLAADAAVAVAPPPALAEDTVSLTIEGAPAGTEVVNPDGIVLGKAPGTIKFAREDAPVKLTLRARGFKSIVQEFTPAKDATISVTLKSAGSGKSRGDGKKTKDKESLEDFGD
jgi:hypothetical protein